MKNIIIASFMILFIGMSTNVMAKKQCHTNSDCNKVCPDSGTKPYCDHGTCEGCM